MNTAKNVMPLKTAFKEHFSNVMCNSYARNETIKLHQMLIAEMDETTFNKSSLEFLTEIDEDYKLRTIGSKGLSLFYKGDRPYKSSNFLMYKSNLRIEENQNQFNGGFASLIVNNLSGEITEILQTLNSDIEDIKYATNSSGDSIYFVAVKGIAKRMKLSEFPIEFQNQVALLFMTFCNHCINREDEIIEPSTDLNAFISLELYKEYHELIYTIQNKFNFEYKVFN